MGSLTAIFALVPTAIAPHEQPASLAQWEPFVLEASQRFGIPLEWIYRVMRAESGGRTMLGGRRITSPKGAMGLMQVMPGTYADMANRIGLGPDPHLPRDNILAGTAYLRLMYDRFGYPGLFAAYNAGPERYSAYLRTGKRLPAETRTYLARLTSQPLPEARTAAGETAERPRVSVFFPLSGDAPRANPAAPAVSNSGLFVALRDQDSAPK